MRCSSIFMAALLCAGGTGAVAAHPGDPCDGLVQWPLYVAGMPADPLATYLRANPQQAIDFINNGPEVRYIIQAGALRGGDDPLPAEDRELGGLGIEIDVERLAVVLAEMNETPQAVRDDVPEQLRGIAGLSTTLFLQKVLPLNGDPVADRILMGKIRDYTYVRDSESEDPGKGSGHLSVDICTDIDGFVPVNEDHREFFHWDLEVIEDGFVVTKRTEPSDPSDITTYDAPFPGIDLMLPEMTWSPAYPSSVWRRGLDHKLHSSNQWLKVSNVYHRKLDDPHLVRLPNDNWRYEVTEASCIDLFTQGPPPGTFAELAGNDYCLGRCAHPPIVNSGD